MPCTLGASLLSLQFHGTSPCFNYVLCHIYFKLTPLNNREHNFRHRYISVTKAGTLTSLQSGVMTTFRDETCGDIRDMLNCVRDMLNCVRYMLNCVRYMLNCVRDMLNCVRYMLNMLNMKLCRYVVVASRLQKICLT